MSAPRKHERLKQVPTEAMPPNRCPAYKGAQSPAVVLGPGRLFSPTLVFGGLGAILLWAALPPMDLAPLAWFAPVFWCHLIYRQDAPGRRGYLKLALVGFAFWMAALHWLRLPHWATSFGWVALSFYLAWYLPVFVGASRVGVHTLGIPLELSAATVWAGLEVARAHLLTGFTMASLAHTQYRWLAFIQIADIFGTYGLGWIMVFTAATLYRLGLAARRLTAFSVHFGIGDTSPALGKRLLDRATLASVVSSLLILATTLAYGTLRLEQSYRKDLKPTVRVALIQGSEDIRLEDDEQKRERIHRHYLELSFQASRRYRDLDVMVWPETVYGGFLIEADPDAAVPPEWTQRGFAPENFPDYVMQARRNSQRALEELARALRTRLIIGVETVRYTANGVRFYNSAAFVDKCPKEAPPPKSDGIPGDAAQAATQEESSFRTEKEQLPGEAANSAFCYRNRYDKMHLVLFGEYVPFSDVLPVLRWLTPLSTLTTPGQQPEVFTINGVHFSPNICYESVIPHLICRQVRELRKRGTEPDVLVNLTNDGWFWGSSELDMHLICGVFRAVETRKPFLIAANTGFSAVIEATGRIVQQGPRRDVDILVADVGPSPLTGWYLDYGVIPNSILVGTVVALLVLPIVLRLRALVTRRA